MPFVLICLSTKNIPVGEWLPFRRLGTARSIIFSSLPVNAQVWRLHRQLDEKNELKMKLNFLRIKIKHIFNIQWWKQKWDLGWSSQTHLFVILTNSLKAGVCLNYKKANLKGADYFCDKAPPYKQWTIEVLNF